MNQVIGTGTLSHHFHGKYWTTVGIDFSTEDAAKDALKSLGDGWKHGDRYKQILIWTGNSDDLEVLKNALKEKFALKMIPCGYSYCSHQCKNAEIDNCNHSVDRGGTFSITVEVIPSEQSNLFK